MTAQGAVRYDKFRQDTSLIYSLRVIKEKENEELILQGNG
jgi:hypothetical protein